MRAFRLACVALPFTLAMLTTTAPAVQADPSPAPRQGVKCEKHGQGDPATTVPAIGQTWALNYGDNTPFGPGPFAGTIAFHSATEATLVVTAGTNAGLTQEITFKTTRLRECLYSLTWHEPITGSYVTQAQDYTLHRVHSSIVLGTQFIQISGTFLRVE
ncbi:MoaF-related domain-containing protein [Streptomyces jumonjinensis]|uniref:MoaF-like domain-containing protein n=1 Tax=Streptomyces jumonjinensis TaxID=1945 RepID=A0A646KIM3_STRJU|nr:hypothetical protein [Streptomyces jumonjinensis]MQT02115.1 hypothetical protein [Streptomyces jumonjinensis]